MQITEIRMKKLQDAGKIKAIVSVTLDDAIAIHDIKVVEGNKGLFVAMPSKRMPDGEYKDIVHPINKDIREILQASVLSKYQDLVLKESFYVDDFTI